MAYDGLLFEKQDHIGTITLNNPDKLNAFTLEMRYGMVSLINDVAHDDDIRVVILTGTGRGFCTGSDITRSGGRPILGNPQATRHDILAQIGGNATNLPKLNKPVIAAINGACAGGGFSLALNCDFRFASETAKFGALFVGRGIVPDTAMSYILPKMIGVSKAFDVMTRPGTFDANEALQLGIVSKVVPADQLIPTAEFAAKIAEQAPIAVALVKKLVWRYITDDMSRQLDLETWAERIAWQTEDMKEAVNAANEKRKPDFKGK